jgi:proline racemase
MSVAANGISQVATIKKINVVDVHVGGDVHRIVLDGVKELPGSSVKEKMEYLRDHGDGLRHTLLEEPRGGHPSLFADLVVRPSDPKADAGFIIMELMGYPLISGTNTMSTTIALLELGILQMQEGANVVTLEAPGGLVEVDAHCVKGKVQSVTYEAQTPSYVQEKDLIVHLAGYGAVKFDLIWTGAYYPVVNVTELKLKLNASDEAALVAFAREFIPAARKVYRPVHPEFGDQGPLSFVVFACNPAPGPDGQLERRISCYEYPRSSVCRSPAGVPSTAAAAQLVDRGSLGLGDSLRTISPYDSTLSVTVTSVAPYGEYSGVKVRVTGSGWIIAKSELIVNFEDPLTPKTDLASILE